MVLQRRMLISSRFKPSAKDIQLVVDAGNMCLANGNVGSNMQYDDSGSDQWRPCVSGLWIYLYAFSQPKIQVRHALRPQTTAAAIGTIATALSLSECASM
jgi:hypothetical protein